MSVCAQLAEEATSSQTGGAAEALANQLAGASLSDDPGAVVPDPLIKWPVQVSHREAKRLVAALELHQKMCHVNAFEIKHAFPSMSPLQLQAILQCNVCAACKMHRSPFKAVP